MISITGLFVQYFPWSALPILIPIIFFITRNREASGQIINQVEVFYKGNTKAYYPCVVEKDQIRFNIDETEYVEPITHFPRLETRNKRLYRVYLFAEGTGLIEVPPLSHEDKKKIIKFLVDNKVIEDNTNLKNDEKDKLKKKSVDDWTEQELMTFIRYYNFDVEQITDKPMQKSFTSATNAITAVQDRIAKRNQQMDQLGKTSNIKLLAIFLVGGLMGFFMAWAFSLKEFI